MAFLVVALPPDGSLFGHLGEETRVGISLVSHETRDTV
jgi:hypothetical protein